MFYVVFLGYTSAASMALRRTQHHAHLSDIPPLQTFLALLLSLCSLENNNALPLCWKYIVRLKSCEIHELYLTKLIKKKKNSISFFLIPVTNVKILKMQSIFGFGYPKTVKFSLKIVALKIFKSYSCLLISTK